MSSVRLFVLGSLAERGAMHGHQLRLLAEREHIDLWTDFTVGSVYGAIKRLAAEGLIAEERVEREGNYPERQIYAITESGIRALDDIRSSTLDTFTLKPDPFDLALARLDPRRLPDLDDTLSGRRHRIATQLTHHHERLADVVQYLTIAETLAMQHQTHRLQAELDWLDTVIDQLPELITDENSRKVD